MGSEIEELKKEFIITEKEEEERLRRMLERILKFARITVNGEVIFERKDLSRTDRIKLILVARYLGSRLSDSIPGEVTLKELAKMASAKEKVVSARVSELIKEGLVETVRRGHYRVRSLSAAEDIMNSIERKYEKG